MRNHQLEEGEKGICRDRKKFLFYSLAIHHHLSLIIDLSFLVKGTEFTPKFKNQKLDDGKELAPPLYYQAI
jgi:hypothetical protein